MNEIEFYKNNKKQNIDKSTIFFDSKSIIITKKEIDYVITLDFINKKCNFTLKKENVTFPIDIIEMNYYTHENKFILNYELNSEEGVKNTLKIEL